MKKNTKKGSSWWVDCGWGQFGWESKWSWKKMSTCIPDDPHWFLQGCIDSHQGHISSSDGIKPLHKCWHHRLQQSSPAEEGCRCSGEEEDNARSVKIHWGPFSLAGDCELWHPSSILQLARGRQFAQWRVFPLLEPQRYEQQPREIHQFELQRHWEVKLRQGGAHIPHIHFDHVPSFERHLPFRNWRIVADDFIDINTSGEGDPSGGLRLRSRKIYADFFVWDLGGHTGKWSCLW